MLQLIAVKAQVGCANEFVFVWRNECRDET